jgi:hypothetical protein
MFSQPKHYKDLSEEHKQVYNEIHAQWAADEYRYNRNRQAQNFAEMLEAIRPFLDGPENVDLCLACGICWGNGFIGTDTVEFGLLLGKHKNSINDCFKKLGYQTFSGRDSAFLELTRLIPFLNGRSELRHWTVRRLQPIEEEAPVPKTVPEPPQDPDGDPFLDDQWGQFTAYGSWENPEDPLWTWE